VQLNVFIWGGRGGGGSVFEGGQTIFTLNSLAIHGGVGAVNHDGTEEAVECKVV
jgi:hypothetical protein